MLFRKCGSSITLALAERCISTHSCPATFRLLNSSTIMNYNSVMPNACPLKARTRSSSYCNCIGIRGKCWMTPAKMRRSKSSSMITTNLANHQVQHASFISLPGSGLKRKDYAERRILGFSMDQMYDVVADVDKYQDFLPWCQSSLVKTRRKGHIVADLVVGFPPLIESYTSTVTLTKPHIIRAEATQGRLFNQLITTWKFSPGLKGIPKTCVVDFYVSFEFRSSLTSQLANVFFNEVVRAMAGAFYSEAKRRYGAESVPSRKINIVPVSDDNTRDKP